MRGYGKLSERNIQDAMREVRLALLEADVNYQVTREFLKRVQEKAAGEHAESDFTLVGPDAVLMLEVKGGIVERSEFGEWIYRKKSGELVRRSHRGPIDQVRSAWYALKNHVSEKRL